MKECVINHFISSYSNYYIFLLLKINLIELICVINIDKMRGTRFNDINDITIQVQQHK